MRNFIILILLILISSAFKSLSLNESTTNEIDVESESIMNQLNPNGFNINSSGSQDGNFFVSESNLNAMYSIPLSNEEFNGNSINFSLNYNGGIEHKAILGFTNNSDTYRTYSKKIPTWFLSVNGFVVQAFVENRTIFADPNLYSKSRYTEATVKTVGNEKKYIFSNKDFNFSIKGYHYNNRIEPFNFSPGPNIHYNSNMGNSDLIHILKSDGSLLTLINENKIYENGGIAANGRTGTYVEYGGNTDGYAIVSIFEDAPDTCDKVVNYNDGQLNRQSRKVRYFPGDGMEYVFIEYITPYGTDITESSISSNYNISNDMIPNDDPNILRLVKNTVDYMPTIFYLSEIYNDNQRIAEFYYDRHHPYSNQICSDESFGRARLINFNNNWINYGDGEVNIKTANRNTKLHFHNSTPNGDTLHLNVYGGSIYDWIPKHSTTNNPNKEIELFFPSNGPNFLGNIENLRKISRNLSRGVDVNKAFYTHSLKHDFPRSYNHFYLLQYLDYILITEVNDNSVLNKPIEKKIVFEYESVIKKVGIENSFTSSSNVAEYHPVLPYLGLVPLPPSTIGNQKLLERVDGVGDETYQDILASSIQLRDLRLVSIKEPTKIIDLKYDNYDNSIEYTNHNEDDLFYFYNHCVEEVKYSFSDDIYAANPTKTLYLKELNYHNQTSLESAEDSVYISECNGSFGSDNGMILYGAINNKELQFYNPLNNYNYLTIKNKTIMKGLKLLVSIINPGSNSFNKYSLMLPVEKTSEYISNDNSFNNFKVTNRTGYKLLCKGESELNYIKPYFTTSYIEDVSAHIKVRNSLVFYEYEFDGVDDNLKNILNNDANEFKHLLTKEIRYIYKAEQNKIDYKPYFDNNPYLIKEVSKYQSFKLEDSTTISIDRQFNDDENSFLKRYYEKGFFEYYGTYVSEITEMSDILFGSLNAERNEKDATDKIDKNNKVQLPGYDDASDQYSIENYLCYILSEMRNYPESYTTNYGNTTINIKPKFGILESKKQYKYGGIGVDILLNGFEYELESDAIEGNHLTYSQGKVNKEKINESQLYGGSPINSITSKIIDYSVGSQGGGYPSKVINANGALIQNYYVYNQVLHYNKDGSNPVYTMQDYWDPDLVDNDQYPCSNVDYFTPAGKTVNKQKISINDKLIESKNVFRRTNPVGTRLFVRKFKPNTSGIAEYHNKFPNDNQPYIVNENTVPLDSSGSYYSPVNSREITSLNTAYEYDDLGRVTAEIDVNGFLSRFSYDNFGRIKKINLPLDFNSQPENSESEITIDAVTMTKEKYLEAGYNIIKNTSDEVEKLTVSSIDNKVGVEDKVFFDKFKAGGEQFPFIIYPENPSDFENETSIKTDLTIASAIMTFRPPTSVLEIESINKATLSFNIKDIPVIEYLDPVDQKALNKDNLVLYIKIPDLNNFQKKILITPQKQVYLTDISGGTGSGTQIYDSRIEINLGSYINLNDLKELFNSDQNINDSDLNIKSSKLIVEISPFPIGGEEILEIELYRGQVEFYNNTVYGQLKPILDLEGQFSLEAKKGKEYFMRNEFTLMNNYGDFGDYVNSYKKIDNQPKPPVILANMNFYNNYAKLGYNYTVSKSKVQDNALSNGFYYLKEPVGYDNSSTNIFSPILSFDNKLLQNSVNIYDENKIHLTDLETKNKYYGTGELIETELNDGTKLNIEYNYSDASEFATNFTDIDFYGFAKKVKTIKHDVNNDIADLDVFDMLGNLVLSFKNISDPSSWNPSADQYSKLVKYYYDLNKNIRKVSEYMGAPNKFRNIYYWYNVFGRVNHSYHPDFGYTHFSYDKVGNLRFKQDQKQFEADRVSYYQYDDLNRLVVSGDAKIDPAGFPNNFNPEILNSNTPETAIFNTMLDVKDVNGDFIINPNLLNDGGESNDGAGNRVLTSNKTLWKDRTYDCYIYDGIINDTLYTTTNIPLILDKANSILGTDYNLPPKGIVHKNYVFADEVYPNSNNNGAQHYNFEEYDTFIRRVNFYDELPPRIGRFWKFMPNKQFIGYLSYDNGIMNDIKDTLYNLRGRVAVQAYREYEKQPFNFIFYSYDARGRIESLIRFTENLGFDCIYYQYNSLDKITKMNVVGPNESIKTAYEYDGFGRLEKVYSSVFGIGHGLASMTGTDYLNGAPPSSSLPINFLNILGMQPDIVYTYDSDNKIASTTYSPSSANIKITNFYDNSLRILGEIKAIDNSSNELFKEDLGYDLLQRINSVTNSHWKDGLLIKSDNMTYGYDNINQLVAWTENMIPAQQFNYDALGNRTSSMNFLDAPDIFVNYTYDIANPESSRLLQAKQPNKWEHTYDYYSTGQLRERKKSKKVINAQPGGQDAVWTHTKEKYDYNSFGLLREYKSDYYFGSYDCEIPFDESDAVVWRYGYNPFNERESKRMVKSPDGDMGGHTYPMMYYLLDEKNRQHINYLGMQSSNQILTSYDPAYPNVLTPVPNKFPNYYWPTCLFNYGTPPSKSEQVLVYPAQLNVFGGGSTPQISYKYDNATTSWKKHYNIYDHLGTLAQTYKEDVSSIIPTSMQTHNPFGGERWTNSNLTTKESTLLNWVGKEKDNESKLGDHGVRKYEYETGRFISIDPLWSSYYGWTPYQYSMNSPVMLVDVDGLDVTEIMKGTGEVTSYTEDDNEDEFHIVDKKGNRIPNASISFKSGTITNYDNSPIEFEGKTVAQTRFTIDGDDNASKIFEFLADPENTQVEWGLGRLGNSNSENNMVGTNHMKGNNPFGGWLFSNQYESVKEYWHNHPSGLPIFSTPDNNSINYYKDFSPNTKFGIFVWPSIYVEH